MGIPLRELFPWVFPNPLGMERISLQVVQENDHHVRHTGRGEEGLGRVQRPRSFAEELGFPHVLRITLATKGLGDEAAVKIEGLLQFIWVGQVSGPKKSCIGK